MRARIVAAAEAVGEGVDEALSLLRARDPSILLGASAYLLFDVAMLGVCFKAFGNDVPPAGVLLVAYLVGQLGSLIPIPGGIGGVDGGLIGTLVLYGVDPADAAVAVIAYRGLLLAIPAILGLPALAVLRRRLATEAHDIAACAPGQSVEVLGRRHRAPDRAGGSPQRLTEYNQSAMASTVRTARPLAANRAHGRAALCAGCVALAVASLALPSAPSYDPWAWLVFGKELATPGLGFSTVAHTGWKPLAVLFTAPLALAGPAAPSLWLVVVRVAGLAALALAFRLAARAGGRIAGVLAALALLAGSDWLRYLSAGNIEPLVVALMLGAIELHLRARRGQRVPPRRAGGPGPPRGVAARHRLRHLRPAERAALVAARARRPGHVRPLDRARLAGLGRSAAHLPPGPDQRRAAQPAGHGGSGAASSCAALPASRPRPCGSVRCAAWPGAGAPAIAPWPRSLWSPRPGRCPPSPARRWATRRSPATSSFPRPSPACSPGSGWSPSRGWRPRPRGRAALAAALVAVCAPFAVSRAIGLGHQAAGAKARADEVSALWRAVDQARRVAPVARLHPVVQPSGMANGLAWKLGLPLDHVAAWFSPTARVAFIAGDDRPVIARLRRRNATAVRIAAAPPWHVLLVRWSSRSTR